MDQGLRSYLYTQAETSMSELLNKGAISPSGHAEILKILHQEQGGGQQMGYPAPYPNNTSQQQYQPYQQYQAPPQNGYMPAPYGNVQPMQEVMQQYQQTPPAQPLPHQQSAPLPPPQDHAPPEKQHSSLNNFGKRMGNNVVNGVSSGFGLTLGSDMANSLWHKVT